MEIKTCETMIAKKTNIYKYILLNDIQFTIYSKKELDYVIYKHYYFQIKINKNKIFIKVHKNYRWDGPSGPTIDTNNFIYSSLIHDVLYQWLREDKSIINKKQYRKLADKLLYLFCKQSKMFIIRRIYVYITVRLFAKNATKYKKEKIIEFKGGS